MSKLPVIYVDGVDYQSMDFSMTVERKMQGDWRRSSGYYYHCGTCKEELHEMPEKETMAARMELRRRDLHADAASGIGIYRHKTSESDKKCRMIWVME